MCVPAVSQHAEGGPEDGSDRNDGTADVLVGNRSGRLAQPWVVSLGQNCNIDDY